MEDYERRAQQLAEDRARHDETKQRIPDDWAQPSGVIHRDDGLLSDWSETMPKKPPPLTADEVKQWIADAVASDEIKQIIRAELAEHDWNAKAFVERKLAEHHEGKEMRPVTRAVLKGLVEGLRKEISTEVGLLRADVTIEKAAAARELGDVIDLPAFIGKRNARSS